MSETMDNEKFEKEALQVVENFLKSNMQVLIVSGRAGSGKSTLAGKIYELANKNNGSEYSQAQILSPTGQSVGLIKQNFPQIPEQDCQTIYRKIYRRATKKIDDGDNLIFDFKLNKQEDKNVFIIDDASYISDEENNRGNLHFGSGKLLTDLLTSTQIFEKGNVKIIFIGDEYRLLPIRDTSAKALKQTYFEELGLNTMKYELKTQYRMHGELARGIDKYAELITSVENHQKIIPYEFKNTGNVRNIDEADWSKEEKKQKIAGQFNRDNKRNKVVVTYSTRAAQEYNKLIRRKLQNMEDAPISSGDLVVFSKNQYDLLVMDAASNEFNEDFFTGDIAEIIATYDRKSSNVRVNNQDVTLSYVKVKYRLERTGKEYVSYLLENVLNSDDSQLSSDERTALFYDAEERIGITETPEEHCRHIKSNNEYWETAIKKLANVGESGLSVSDKDRIRELLRKHPICDPKNECERYQLLDKIYQDKFYNSIQVKYAYAMTGHKVQGNEWNDVYVDFTDRNGLDESSLRWTYTALSRAIKNVLVFNATSLFGNFDISNEFIGKKKNLEKEREMATKIEEYQFNDEKIARLVDKVEEISENNGLVVTNIDDRNFEKQYFVLIYLSDVENNNYVMQAYYNSRKFWTKATLRSKVEIADKLELIGAEFKKINPNFRGSADNE